MLDSAQSYIHVDGNRWDIGKVRENVLPEDVDKIMALKISSKAELDLLGWHYTDDEIYTVKSEYWLDTLFTRK